MGGGNNSANDLRLGVNYVKRSSRSSGRRIFMFLTQEKVSELTGRTRPSAQARWLTEHGWRYSLNANGVVIVHELEAQRQLCGYHAGRRAVREEPDLEALDEGV